MMDRRRFVLTALAGVVASPLLAEAQHPPRIPRIGVLRWTSQPDAFQTTFRQALTELGYVEGHNIAIEWRWADDRPDVADRHAADLRRLAVDVIVASPTPAAHAARNATQDIPIVISGIADPVASGLVRSIARPEGNVTGVSLNLPAAAGKRLQILHEVFPTLRRAAFLGSASDPATNLFVSNTLEAAKQLRIRIDVMLVAASSEFEHSFAAMAQKGAGAVIVQPIFVSPRERSAINELALRYRLPTISDLRGFAEAGGLISYGPNQRETSRRVAGYVARIISGAKPADLPIEEPTTFELVINLKTAKALRVTIPPALLLRADHTIE